MGGLRCFKTGWDARLFVHRGNLDLNNRAVLAFWTCPAVRPRPFRPSPSPFDIAAINLGHMRLPLSVSARGPAGAPRTHPKRSRRRTGRPRHVFACPIVSAILAPCAPMGFGAPDVVSRAVWCSISPSSSAPSRITMTDNHIQVIKPNTAPSEP
jgi:hypothetical protein